MAGANHCLIIDAKRSGLETWWWSAWDEDGVPLLKEHKELQARGTKGGAAPVRAPGKGAASNRKTVRAPAAGRGDHLRVKRWKGVYSHHGIDVGGGRVIHFDGEPLQKFNATIRKVSKRTFADGGVIEVVHHSRCDPPTVVVKRAESKLGERGYNLAFNNCEHFAFWCKTGRKKSRQVRRVAVAGGVGVTGAGTYAAVKIAQASAESAATGTGITSGLTVLGGGATAGAALTLAGPAALVVATGIGLHQAWEWLSN